MPPGQQTSTSQQTSTPDPKLTAANHFGFDQAKQLYNSSSPAYYPGSTVANQSPTTQAGNQGAIARAINGSPVNTAAGGYLQNVLGGAYMPGGGGGGNSGPQVGQAQAGGGYSAQNPPTGRQPPQLQPGQHMAPDGMHVLDSTGKSLGIYQGNDIGPSSGFSSKAQQMGLPQPNSGGAQPTGMMPAQQGGGGQPGIGGNPYTDALNRSIFDSVNSNVESQMSLGGRYGSPTMGSEIARQSANAIAPQVYGNYQNERGLQQQAAGLAPTIANQDWTDINQLQQTGANQDQYNQSLVNSDVNHWNYNQNLDQNKLAQYMGLINGANVGTSGTTTNTQPGGGLMGILGGLAGGFLGGL